MRRASLTVGVVALAGVCAVGAPSVIAATPATDGTRATTTLSGSAAPVTRDRLRGDAVRASQSQTVEVWMAGHEQAAQRFVDAVSTPGSASYHRFLSPSAYTQRFGPSGRAGAGGDVVSDPRGVHPCARQRQRRLRLGHRVAVDDRPGVLGADGPPPRRPQGASTTMESSDRDPTVPASIRSDILSVTGVYTIQSRASDATAGAGGSTSTATAPTSSGAGANARGLLAVLGAEDDDDQPRVSRSDRGRDPGVRLLGQADPGRLRADLGQHRPGQDDRADRGRRAGLTCSGR